MNCTAIGKFWVGLGRWSLPYPYTYTGTSIIKPHPATVRVRMRSQVILIICSSVVDIAMPGARCILLWIARRMYKRVEVLLRRLRNVFSGMTVANFAVSRHYGGELPSVWHAPVMWNKSNVVKMSDSTVQWVLNSLLSTHCTAESDIFITLLLFRTTRKHKPLPVVTSCSSVHGISGILYKI